MLASGGIFQLMRSMESQIYAATRAGRPLRVYSLVYRDSLEGDRMAALLARERRTFEDLIRQKGHMVLPDLAQARPTRNNTVGMMLFMCPQVEG